jgi:hypothetical protein
MQAMTRSTPAFPVFPADFLPTKSSSELITQYIVRSKSRGVTQKVLALALGFGANYVSMLKTGEELPLGRVLAFALAAELSETERCELLSTRVIELDGCKAEICVDTLAQWAVDLLEPVGDERTLLNAWRDAIPSSSTGLPDLLDDPKTAARVRAFFNGLVSEHIQSLRDDETAPCTVVGPAL